MFNVGDSVGVYRRCLLAIDKIPRCSMLGAEMADALSKGEFEMFGDLGAEYSGRLLVISD